MGAMCWLCCAIPRFFGWIIDHIFFDGMGSNEFTLFIMSALLSSIIIYVFLKFLGDSAGIMMILVGVGGLITVVGTPLIVFTIFGLIFQLMGKRADLIVGINILMYIFCFICYF